MPKGVYMSVEARERKSVIMKEVMNRPEVKSKIKEAMNRPEVKAKQSAAMREIMSIPEVKANRTAALKEYNNRSEVKLKKSMTMKQNWSIPEFKANRIVSMKECDRPIVKARSVARAIEIMSIPPKDDTRIKVISMRRRNICTLIAAHNEMMKDDPERLSTEFMMGIIKS